MFIYCVDNDLKQRLINKGLKLLKEDEDGAVFVFDRLKFNFEGVDSKKYFITNKLTF